MSHSRDVKRDMRMCKSHAYLNSRNYDKFRRKFQRILLLKLNTYIIVTDHLLSKKSTIQIIRAMTLE